MSVLRPTGFSLDSPAAKDGGGAEAQPLTGLVLEELRSASFVRILHAGRRYLRNLCRCAIIAARDESTTKDEIISRDPGVLSGMPVFRGTRVPIKNLLDYLKAGDTLEEFLDDFPSVTREQAEAVFEIIGETLLTK